ncbi:MAG: right-handed parallel beta-helix repeat-containing protein, partial [Candidatus Methanoperedens sp.]|nr:right-handed parallel beta-helix repeat-containing protein [Candidatus Methanoperedens sp.]MCZ7405012.1 right-handed parallel beta-helix repeat-containing protein [Candidatus Methanoperedens sp.]
MGKEFIKYITPFVLTLLVFGMMAGTASATLFFNYTLNGTATTVAQGGNNVSLNFTIRDDAIATTFYNISFSTNTATGFFVISPGVNTSSKTNITATNQTDNIGNFTLLGDNAVWNVTNVSGAGAFVNVSFNGSNSPTGNVTAANNEAFINITNITLPSAGGLYFINLTTNLGVTYPLSLTIDTTGPSLTALPTVYGPSCGNYASDTCPYFTLNVMVTDNGTGVNASNVTANVSIWNNTGFFVMNPNGTSGANYNFSLNVTVDKVVRGTYNATVTAYDNYSVSNTTNLSVEAHRQVGLSVIGYTTSKGYPAYPTFVSMFYNYSNITIIVNTTDATNYSNITVYFGAVDGSSSVEFNNSGVLLPDGNYTYMITHNLSTIPTNDVRTAWVNATFTPPGDVPITIHEMASLVVVSNVNPINTDPTLGGATTNWPDIPDYTNAYLTFEAVNATNNYKVATLRFNDPINLTNYTTARNLSLLGQKLSIAGSSINLSGAADALIAFNKSANLTIYNLTSFTTSPAIFADGVLIALPDQSTGGAASDISWNQTAQSLTLNVSHWTSYSWGTYGVNLTNTSALSSTATVVTNATYTFILQNNGTLNDTYNITISNPSNAIAVLTPSGNITLAPNQAPQLYTLNVTNTTAGTYYVNVTATSTNFSNRTGSINTTTTVTTDIGSCGTISAAGTYTLNQNINSASTCINITSSNVTLDGAGYTINGTNAASTNGVYVNATNSIINVTVKNVRSTNWQNGIKYENAHNGSIINNTVSSNGIGIDLTSSGNNTLRNNTISSNTDWTALYSSQSNNNTLENNTITSNAGNGMYIGFDSSSNTINSNVVSNSCTQMECNGIFLDHNASNNTVFNNTVSSNINGIYLNDNSNYNNISNNTVSSNTQYGIAIVAMGGGEIGNSNNILNNNNLSNNNLWDFYANSSNSSGVMNVNNTVQNTRIGTTTVSFTFFEVALRAASSPASDPSGYLNIGKYINATNNSAGSWLFLNVSYNDSDVANVTESRLLMWKYSGSWSQVAGTNGVNTTQNYVYANITSFSIFAPMAGTAAEYGSLNGTIVDNRLGTPLASVTVSISNTTGGTNSATTDSNGTYYIPNVVTSSTNAYIYTVTASKTNYITNTTSVTVLNSSTNTTLNINLTAYNGTLQGTYNKAGTSIGISGATVNITNTTLGSIIRTTDSSGFYSASLYPATYTVNVSKTGYSNSNTSATVTSNATNNTGTISLSPNTVTITANRTVGTADPGLAQNVSFNLTVVNTGDDATFIVTNTSTNVTIVTNTTTPSPLELNTSTPTGY